MQNREVAERLEEVAAILNEQGANVYRIAAYRRAARTLRQMERPVVEIVETEGIPGLQKLPGIGVTLSRFIFQLVTSGKLPMLERLRGESDPAKILATVPGIGRLLAEKIHQDLGIDTLEELEAAAYDGRLSEIEGLGWKRLAGIRDSLSARLGRLRKTGEQEMEEQAPVSEVFDVDQEYRMKALRKQLPLIAPRRFNPSREAWLPVLHTQRGKRHYTALFSNTARAHQLGKTRDWVVIYYHGDGVERQCTVTTGTGGEFKGCRVVRGREADCRAYYSTPKVS